MKMTQAFDQLVLAAVLSLQASLFAADAGPFRFEHRFIDPDVPTSEQVVGFAMTALADLDHDGDLDFIVGHRGGGDVLYWYEYRAPNDWVRHRIGTEHQSDVAAAVMDVDGDGWLDVVCSGVWFRNPHKPREGEFERHVFDSSARGAHDALVADIDRDGRKDVLLMGDGRRSPLKELCWYAIPKDPTKPWVRHSIGPPVHGAITPGAAFDVDGDGDIDVVRADTWFENVDGRGLTWQPHANVPVGRVGPYGMCVRALAVDIDGDGHLELVVADADILECGVAILRNADGRGGQWEKQALPQSFVYGSLHSLAVADFDGDGDMDILVNEQEDMLPADRTNPRWVIWENQGDGNFVERIILDRQLGGHELVVGDVDGDGDIDIVSKPWRIMPWNGAGGRMHIDFLENSRIDAKTASVLAQPLVSPRQRDGNGTVEIDGELRQWHKVTLSLAGPYAHERDTQPNAFTDYRLTATFEHESGAPRHVVPGYFAADGRAAETGADSGTVWRAHVSLDKPGRWSYRVSFVRGARAALEGGGDALAPFDGKTGSFVVARTDKSGRDFRGKGRLGYAGGHYLRFAGGGEYFLKAGADAPETLLAYSDFDGTEPGRKRAARTGEAEPTQSLKTWTPHLGDWRAGDPEWRDGRGRGLIGALNYLAAKGLNAFSFLPYNAGGDGDSVWPFIARDAKFHYDCSKLDQWGIVFDHATRLGLFLHFKLQETENDDSRLGQAREPADIPESLDGGVLGPERKLYLRELIARFGHALALNWNLGEENTQSPEEQRAMARFIADTDPYDHLIVVHTYPQDQERVYSPLLGTKSALSGASLQNPWNTAHARTLHWVAESTKAGKPWVVCNDEQNPAWGGVPPDAGYKSFSGQAVGGGHSYDLHDIRKATLWGTLLAGGAGVEYYFGYRLPENDLVCEDFRSRDKSWDYCRTALTFFRENKVPFWKMKNANALVGNAKHDNSRYCFAKAGELYLVYLPDGGAAELDLGAVAAHVAFSLSWFNPRTGGALQAAGELRGGANAALNAPDANDWLAVVRRKQGRWACTTT